MVCTLLCVCRFVVFLFARNKQRRQQPPATNISTATANRTVDVLTIKQYTQTKSNRRTEKQHTQLRCGCRVLHLRRPCGQLPVQGRNERANGARKKVIMPAANTNKSAITTITTTEQATVSFSGAVREVL